MRPISTLHVVHSFDNRQGGVVHSALSTAKYLIAAGHPADVVGSWAPADDLRYLAESFPMVPHHRIPRTVPHWNFHARGLDAWMEAELRRFDLVQLHSIWTGTTARAGRVCRRLGKPYVVLIQNSLDPFDLAKRSLLKRLLGPVYVRSLLQGSRGVLCTTELERDRLVTFGARPQRFVVPLAVPQLGIGNLGRQGFRKRYGIPESAFVVMFLSRFDVKKGLQFLIPALAKIKRTLPELWFVCAGTGVPAYVAEVHRLLDEYHARAWTVLPGFLSGELKQAAFAASDAFALPSLNENFGMVVVEALQSGVPTVISDEVFLHAEVEKAGAGVICKPNAHSCAEALRTIIERRIDVSRMVRRGQELAEGEFSPVAATRKLLECYRMILSSDHQYSDR